MPQRESKLLLKSEVVCICTFMIKEGDCILNNDDFKPAACFSFTPLTTPMRIINEICKVLE